MRRLGRGGEVSTNSEAFVRWPYWMRRPGLLMAGLRADRDAPDLETLRALEPAERFVWGILPHAARSFAPCIVALPGRLALPAALAYLYCRVLDTYEDLIEDTMRRREALVELPERLEGLRRGAGLNGPAERRFACRDARDEAHALLAEEVGRLDALFLELEDPVQAMIVELVRDMSEGMRWAAAIFEEQGGALADGGQLRTYCDAVLGNPIRFAARLFSWEMGGDGAISEELETAAMDVGEFLQLANVTRDIEKDLARGVAYHPDLAGDLGGEADQALGERVRLVRAVLLDRALALAPAYSRLVEGLRLGAGWKSASALIMLRFTERYYRGCASRVGVEAPVLSGPGGLVWGSWPALVSGAWTRAELRGLVERLGVLRGELPAQASSMYLS